MPVKTISLSRNEAIAKQREFGMTPKQAPKRPTRLTSLAVGPESLFFLMTQADILQKIREKADKYAKNEVKTAEKTAKKAKNFY